MFKTVENNVWVFDVEWVPDPEAGRRLFQLPEDTPDAEVIQKMWEEGGADKENPMPYLKTTICRVISIAAVIRTVKENGEIILSLTALPHDAADSEQAVEFEILSRFLNAVGEKRPQLVGYNSAKADMKILLQRAVANGVQAAKFAKRPNKPWEGADYFDSRNSEGHLDLIEILGGFGKANPSLNEMATVCGIPGKLGVSGEEVAPMWLDGRLVDIVAYNECDALTTYLLWLRMAYFAGFFNQQQYSEEQERVRNLLNKTGALPGKEHLLEFLERWEMWSPVGIA
ncbi:MAG: 3'-5' exonuclease [SAR324 cluster bacterium]|nr:3'-5' exonuclease [SAR324 cluster bacterium]MBL7034388.1 3'-5' exonuclease [SAR324 cluster bacterium]